MTKIAFDKLRQSMQHFLNFPEVEAAMDVLVAQRTQAAMLASVANDARSQAEVLAEYLQTDDANQEKLTLILGLSVWVAGKVEKDYCVPLRWW